MLNVLGCQIHLEEEGNGPPILLLHGSPDSSQMWAPVVKSLATSYRCIVPDLPGYGRSKAPSDFDYSLAGQVAFMDALHDALRTDGPVHVVAHDFGGIFGAAWMAASTSRIRSFTAINTAFSVAYRWHFWARVWRTPLLGELSMLTMNRKMFGVEMRRGSRQLTKEHIDATYALLTPSVKRTILNLYRAVHSSSFVGWEDRYQEAAKSVPVMVLWGEGDPYIPNAMVDSFSARKIVKVPGAGHFLPVVEPIRTAREVILFLESAA